MDWRVEIAGKIGDVDHGLVFDESLLFAANPCAMFFVDRETLAMLDVNDAALEQYGYSREEFLSLSLLHLRSAEDPPSLFTFPPVLPGQFHLGQWRHLHKDGSPVVVDLVAQNVAFRGRPAALVAAFDVTGRYRAEQALRESESRAQRLQLQRFESTEQHRGALDQLAAQARQQRALAALGQRALQSGTVGELAGAAVQVVAATLGVELCGVLKLAPERDRLVLLAGIGWRKGLVGKAQVSAGARSPAGHALEADEAVIVEDLRAETRFDRPPLHLDHGAVSGIAVVIGGAQRPFGVLEAFASRPRRFTHDEVHFLQAAAHLVALALRRRTAEDELRVTQTHLHQSQKMEAVGRLAGGVAHDFNNLLTGILGISGSLLLDLPPGAPIRADLEELQGAARRAATLTRQLLDFSRRGDARNEPVDLNAVVLDSEKLLSRLTGGDVTLTTVLDAEAGRVRADPGQIDQILVNLTVNARDAMPAGGRITISTAAVDLEGDGPRPRVRPASWVMLSVSDTGMGMTDEVRARIFEPFFTTKERGKGTGLGLATVYGIVERAGGHIAVESAPGKGSSFRIFLPAERAFRDRAAAPAPEAAARSAEASPPAAPAAPAAMAAGPAPAPRRGTVLLVDDEFIVRRVARRLLEREGYGVVEATGGREALKMVKDRGRTFDLLLSDIMMPEMNGRELLRELRSLYPDLKAIFMSGLPEDALTRNHELEPGVPCLPKPFAAESLIDRVREALDGDAAA